MKTDKFIFTLIFTLVFSMMTLSFESFAVRCEAVRGETLRLHIIADSDSEYDQNNKLLVRDAVLEQYSEVLCGKSVEQAKYFADFLKEEIALTARQILEQNGCKDNVSVEVTDMYFDTRSYQNGITLPAGEYSALRITIGEGKGQNWWCVMYPPLCIPACIEGEAAETGRKIAELELQPAYKAKFAAVELIEKISSSIRK